MDTSGSTFHKPVWIWLWIGLIMVFVQVVVGGITRLTDSGLSITDWAIIQGVIPPMNETEWKEAFELYKTHASKQYLSLHQDMDITAFKWIYFWEYIHRLWARIMGLVFIFPLLFFVVRGWIDKALAKRLGLIFGLAALAGLFGWIMVASGLNDDNRTWVSAYKLITHLGIAVTLFTVLAWTIHWYKKGRYKLAWRAKHKWWFILLFIQILFGGLMAGMRAGLLYPFYPLITDLSTVAAGIEGGIQTGDISNYEPVTAIKGWVQIIHRALALGLLVFAIWLYRSTQKTKEFLIVLIVLLSQYVLGVITVIESIGSIPVHWGALHQAVALLLIYATVRWVWSEGKGLSV